MRQGGTFAVAIYHPVKPLEVPRGIWQRLSPSRSSLRQPEHRAAAIFDVILDADVAVRPAVPCGAVEIALSIAHQATRRISSVSVHASKVMQYGFVSRRTQLEHDPAPRRPVVARVSSARSFTVKIARGIPQQR